MIIYKVFLKLLGSLNRGNERSVRAKKNILLLFVRKGLSVAISYMLVPIFLVYLTPKDYGVWLTITSIIGWLYAFDLGLGSGFRNMFSEALVKKDVHLGRVLVSTTYTMLFIIVVVLIVLFLIIGTWIPWWKVFNTLPEYNSELWLVIGISFSFFCVIFVINLIGTILAADQRLAVFGFFNTIASTIVLVSMFILPIFTSGSLIFVALVSYGSYLIVLLAATFYLFSNDYKSYKPSFRYIDFSYSKGLLMLGMKFFLIQISALLVLSTTNLMITQWVGTEYVASYSIAYKYFNVAFFSFTLITSPYWSAFTDAYLKNDYPWMKTIVSKLIKLWLFHCLMLLLLLCCSSIVYLLWVGDKVTIPWRVNVSLFVYFVFLLFQQIFITFIYGVGKLHMSIISAIIEAVFVFPIAYLFVEVLGFGVEGIIVAVTIPVIFRCLWIPYQYYLIINRKASGVWNK